MSMGGICRTLSPYVLASTVIANYTDYNGSYDPDEVMELIETTDFIDPYKSINKAQYIQFRGRSRRVYCLSKCAFEKQRPFFHDLRNDAVRLGAKPGKTTKTSYRIKCWHSRTGKSRVRRFKPNTAKEKGRTVRPFWHK